MRARVHKFALNLFAGSGHRRLGRRRLAGNSSNETALREVMATLWAVRLAQYGLNASSRMYFSLQQPVVLSQRREVVRFEGDTGRPLTHISREVPISDFSPPSMEIPHIGGLYLRAISLYTTCIFAVVAAMSLVYGASVRFQVLGRNLCRFNRVAGFVWIGRTLLLVRSMTSVIYLRPNNAINNPDDITLRKDGDLMLYNSSSSPVSILALHMKAIQFSILNSIPLAIDDLRRMATRVHVAVASQSILLARLEPDVPMANTTARQLRCSARYASNGAVYLETALRNIANSDFFRMFWR
ncbi:hypothetical protein DYB30_013914 [Aphanomyces astaci]|uniref:Uncharacterized protein n=1 Tax=Aphanomyces astaci TaxID=112090 RepID=A0A397CUC2_APHAT|nr:hypothetical protein DYB30_013914 [Aphanomyces astaci]